MFCQLIVSCQCRVFAHHVLCGEGSFELSLSDAGRAAAHACAPVGSPVRPRVDGGVRGNRGPPFSAAWDRLCRKRFGWRSVRAGHDGNRFDGCSDARPLHTRKHCYYWRELLLVVALRCRSGVCGPTVPGRRCRTGAKRVLARKGDADACVFRPGAGQNIAAPGRCREKAGGGSCTVPSGREEVISGVRRAFPVGVM